MGFLFTNSDSTGFSNLSDSQQAVFSAEKETEIHSVRITNRTDSEIRVFLELAKPLSEPIQRTFVANFRRVLKFGTEDLLVIKNNVDDVTSGGTPTPLRLRDADNLICYSNASENLFDCLIFFTELNETEELV